MPVVDALRALGGSGTPKAVLQKIQGLLALPDSVLTEKMGSGQSRFYNEVAWARKYLVWEGLVESPERGIWTLTAKGKSVVLNDREAQKIAERWAVRHKHYRRYNRKMITELLGDRFELEFFTGFFMPLIPMIFLLRTLPCKMKLCRNSGVVSTEAEHGVKKSIFHDLMSKVLGWELKWIHRGKSIPFGASCLFVAKKARL